MTAKKTPPIAEDDAELLDSLVNKPLAKTDPKRPAYFLWWERQKGRREVYQEYDEGFVFFTEARLQEFLQEEVIASGEPTNDVRVLNCATGKVMRFSIQLQEA